MTKFMKCHGLYNSSKVRISYFNELFCYIKPWTAVFKIHNSVLSYVFIYIRFCSFKLAVTKYLPLELILITGSYLFSCFVIISRTNKSFLASYNYYTSGTSSWYLKFNWNFFRIVLNVDDAQVKIKIMQ